MRQKSKHIFNLFKSDRISYTTLWPKYRLRKAMELWAAIKGLITSFRFPARRTQGNAKKTDSSYICL